MFEVTVCTCTGMPLRRFDLSRLAEGGPPVRIGRAEDCDICIRNQQVSRYHCQVEAVDRFDWVLRDLGSTTGTYHDGLRVDDVEIDDGLEVQVGPALLRFTSARSRVAAELEAELTDSTAGEEKAEV